MNTIWLIVAAVLCLVVGCNSPGADERSPAADRADDASFGVAQWKYITRDGEGNALTEGLLTMPHPLRPDVSFAGSWQARYVGPDGQRDKIGPQLNGGRLTGEFTEGQFRLQLNPNMNDNNVTFIGTVQDDRITGAWEYATFLGVTNKGTFEALLSKD
jgi:hypothetical protein